MSRDDAEAASFLPLKCFEPVPCSVASGLASCASKIADEIKTDLACLGRRLGLMQSRQVGSVSVPGSLSPYMSALTPSRLGDLDRRLRGVPRTFLGSHVGPYPNQSPSRSSPGTPGSGFHRSATSSLFVARSFPRAPSCSLLRSMPASLSRPDSAVICGC